MRRLDDNRSELLRVLVVRGEERAVVQVDCPTADDQRKIFSFQHGGRSSEPFFSKGFAAKATRRPVELPWR